MPRPIALKPLILTLCVVLLMLSTGCLERRVIRSSWDALRNSAWSDNRSSDSYSTSNSGRSNRGYAIEIDRYSGTDAYSKVYHLVREARVEAGLANLWYTTSGEETIIYAGRFKEKDSDEAEAMLREVRNARIRGRRAFENAKIVEITRARAEVSDPRDLRSLTGKDLYTLQIGYYDRGFGTDFRKAAETAVDILREAGETAYYYHGPNRSLVLINKWTRREAFTLQGNIDRYSNIVRIAQEKYPYNVPNGQPFTADDDPDYVKTQHSSLIKIP